MKFLLYQKILAKNGALQELFEGLGTSGLLLQLVSDKLVCLCSQSTVFKLVM